MTAEKITRQRQATFLGRYSTLAAGRLETITNYSTLELLVTGYEIHQGRTYLLAPEEIQPLFDDPDLGMVNQDQSIWGTYLHGLFDNGPWRRTWLNHLRQRRGLQPLPIKVADYHEQREVFLDSVTDAVAAHLDLTAILQAAGSNSMA